MYRPAVVIREETRGYEMKVEGMNDSVMVIPANVIESRIEGNLEGWSGDTVFEFVNDQVWQQSSYAYWYHYAYRPGVVTMDSRVLMLADDDSNRVNVRRIR